MLEKLLSDHPATALPACGAIGNLFFHPGIKKFTMTDNILSSMLSLLDRVNRPRSQLVVLRVLTIVSFQSTYLF